jgi:uncharacterized protein
MAHTCAKCGKVYPDSSAEILRGCSCGGRKFYFERPDAQKRSITTTLQEQEPRAAEESPAVPEKPVREDRFSRVESIRILGPGTYELNIEKMAESDDRVVGLGTEGSYAVDLLSMAGTKKGKKTRLKKA